MSDPLIFGKGLSTAYLCARMKQDMKRFAMFFIFAGLFLAGCGQSGSREGTAKDSVLSSNLVKNPNTLTGNDEKLPELTFETKEHDFGKLTEGDKVSFDFRFSNTGEAPLIITEVKASCGCTTPQWPKGVIKPGESNMITVEYNSKGRPGEFSKGIVVTSNTYPNQTVLKISGVVFKK